MFPTKLIEIKNYLVSNEVILKHLNDDNRINASLNERVITDKIQEKFEIDISQSREWFDFSITEKSNFYLVNIKVTTTNTADNLNCKLGIYYALTGLLPDFANGLGYLRYFEKLSKNFKTYTDKDYYFLIVNNTNPTDIFLTHLKGIKTLTPNGNNLPFQCKWGSNREFISRSFDEAADFILTRFGESVKLRAKNYFQFEKFFPQYV